MTTPKIVSLHLLPSIIVAAAILLGFGILAAALHQPAPESDAFKAGYSDGYSVATDAGGANTGVERLTCDDQQSLRSLQVDGRYATPTERSQYQSGCQEAFADAQ